MEVHYIRDADVQRLLTMADAVRLVESAMRDRAVSHAADSLRTKAYFPSATLRLLPAWSSELGVVGHKATYSAAGHATRGHVYLIDSETGVLKAIVESLHLSVIRTGAASAVATRHLARKTIRELAQAGTGALAMAQLEAVCLDNDIQAVRVYGRDRARLEQFCLRAQDILHVPVDPAESVAQAVAGADVINLVTKASEPVLRGEWLEPGQHINAAGSNALDRREIDEAAIRRSDVIVVDSREGARDECGDLLPLVQAGDIDLDTLPELGEVMVGKAAGRTSASQITLYESHGMGVQDLYAAHFVAQAAARLGLGTMFRP